MLATWRKWVLVGVLGLVGCRTTGTAVRETPETPRQQVQFDPVTVTADLELASLNDEELFAGGTSAFAANDFAKAARYFGRLADFHPQSKHREEALYNAGLSHERLEQWDEAYLRFSELADAEKGTGDALDAAFRLAETQYHMERFAEAAQGAGHHRRAHGHSGGQAPGGAGAAGRVRAGAGAEGEGGEDAAPGRLHV